MVEEFLDFAVEQRVQIPKLINLHEVRIIAGEDEVGVVLEKQVRDVVQVDKTIQRGRAEAVFAALFVTEQSGGFVHVVNQVRKFRQSFRDMMVNDDPVGFVEARFKREVGHPRGFFARLALLPEVVVVSFQRNVHIEEFSGEPLQQHTGDQTIEIALVGEDYIWLRQGDHRVSKLVQTRRCGEKGIR